MLKTLLESVEKRMNSLGYAQRNDWQVYRITENVHTFVWINTFWNPKTSEQSTVMVDPERKQFNMFNWDDCEILSI